MPTSLSYTDGSLFQGITTLLCALGSIIAIIICTLLLSQLVYHLRTTSKIKIGVNQQQSKSTCCNSNKLVVAYLTTAIITCIIYAFIRSNVFTFISASQFTMNQCAGGYFFGFVAAGINRMCLYFLFLYRIMSVFEGSSYEYKPKTFKRIRIIIITTYSFITIVAIWIFLQNTEFVVTSFNQFQFVKMMDNFDFVWCGHHSDGDMNRFWFAKYILIGWYILIIIGEFAINFVFLWMFLRGLYGLQNSIISSHKSLKNVMKDLELQQVPTNDVEEMQKIDEAKNMEYTNNNNMDHNKNMDYDNMNKHIEYNNNRHKETLSVYTDNEDDDGNGNKNGNELSVRSRSSIISKPRSGSIGFHDMMTEYQLRQGKNTFSKKINNDSSIKLMVKLHHLTKKTTILVCIAIGSSVVYWILSAINGWYSILIPWDILINSICCWLMLRSSIKYWNCCAKYGICRCCYKQFNDDIL